MRRNTLIVVLILVIFFVISFFTNILGTLNPSVSESFTLTETLAGFLPFSFFIAYGVMSIPSGFLVERFREKKIIILAFILSLLGSLLFANFPTFRIFLISLFTIGAGMAMLQVVINPLLRVAGGGEHYAFYSVLAQLVFGLASFVSPKMYSYLVTNAGSELTNPSSVAGFLSSLVPSSMSWASVYWVFAIISVLMLLLVFLTKFPKVELKEDEKMGTKDSYLDLFKNKYVILFFLGIFAYVGTEQGVSYWMSKFLANYHGYDHETIGANAVGNFWGLMTVGGILGLILLKIFDSKQVLIWFTMISMIGLVVALFGGKTWALFAFPIIGFFMSVMYPIIISLALNSVDKHHGSFAGILMTGIMGGAVVQLLVGAIADMVSLKTGMIFLFIPLGYIFSIGIWAKPLVNNATVKSWGELFGKKKK